MRKIDIDREGSCVSLLRDKKLQWDELKMTDGGTDSTILFFEWDKNFNIL